MPSKITPTPNVLFLIVFFLASCSSFAPAPTATPTSTHTPTATFTPIPTVTFTPSPTLVPAPERATYTLDTAIDYDAHTVDVNETIVYPNHTGGQLNALVLAVEPNLWEGGFTLTSVSIDGVQTTTYSLEGQRLDIALSSFFQPETVLNIEVQYTLTLPFADQQDPSISRPRIYGYTLRQLNLTNWYPFVVPYINGEWILHEPWVYGEHLVYDAADYEVNLKFTDPASVPIVASSGFAEPQVDFVRYTITSARAFAISASREFQVSTLQLGDVTVSSYYFPSGVVGGQAVLKTTAEAIQVFGERYGPYPHKTLSIVMADFKDSTEFSAFYYHSPLYYEQYDGTPLNYLTFIGAHETAHQWWFEQVGNDQAQQPWLDEGLATYSEHVYYEGIYPDLVRDWWAYRVDFFNPQGFVDLPVYEGQGFEPYRKAVYLRGAHFLDDLRGRIGDEAFFAFIQDYLTQGRGKIVNADDFFRILSMHTSTDYSDLVRQYLQNIY